MERLEPKTPEAADRYAAEVFVVELLILELLADLEDIGERHGAW